MNRIDLRRVDLNLLVVFEMIMLERNLTRAAERLFLGQSAVSAALTRLRALYNDPLFVRIGRQMEPTTRAFEVAAVLRPALDSIPAAVSQTSQFDPSTSRDVIRLGLSDDVELALLPRLLRQLSIEAPEMVVVIRRTQYLSVNNQLSSGEISLGICYTDELPSNTKRRTLRRSQSVIVHADIEGGPMTLDEYCARPHALVSFAGDLSGFIDHELAALGRIRHVKRAIPQFQGLAILLPGTSLIATVPDYAAAALTDNGHLRKEALPFPAPVFDLSMAWNALQDLDPAQRWLRSKIIEWLGDRK
ncbi:MAG: LysR family transcriptional regulator [Janthinobacterium lividum]